ISPGSDARTGSGDVRQRGEALRPESAVASVPPLGFELVHREPPVLSEPAQELLGGVPLDARPPTQEEGGRVDAGGPAGGVQQLAAEFGVGAEEAGVAV